MAAVYLLIPPLGLCLFLHDLLGLVDHEVDLLLESCILIVVLLVFILLLASPAFQN